MKYSKLEKYIREQISRGSYVDRLPSENDLCLKFDVSRVTVRAALQVLKEDGIIQSLRGKGYFVTKDGVSLSTRSLPQPRLFAVKSERLNSYNSKIIMAIEKACSDAGMGLNMFYSAPTGRGADRLPSIVDGAQAPGVKGVVLLDYYLPKEVRVMQRSWGSSTPVLSIGHRILDSVSSLTQDTHRIGEISTQFLLYKGCDKLFVFQSESQLPEVKQRVQAAREVCTAAGISFVVVQCGWNPEDVQASVLSHISEFHQCKPGLLFFRDTQARAAVSSLVRAGLVPGKDFEAMGFGHFGEMNNRLFHTINAGVEHAVYEACVDFARQAVNGENKPRHHVNDDFEIIDAGFGKLGAGDSNYDQVKETNLFV